MLKEAFTDNVPSLAQASEWFKRFKQKRVPIDDGGRPGRPPTGRITENVAKVREDLCGGKF
jgi:hypothetical protein